MTLSLTTPAQGDVNWSAAVNQNFSDIQADFNDHRARHVSGGADAFLSTDVLEAIVKRLRETGGPTTLSIGAVADGEFLKRSGTSVVGASLSSTQVHTVNGFRLTLTSGTPVTTSDVIGATTIYLSPHSSNEIWTYDSSLWTRHGSAEISKALGTLSAVKPHDVFVYWTGSVLDLEFVIWTDGTTRATDITRQDGVWVKQGTASRRYVGTFYPTSTTQTEDSVSKRFLWNLNGRVLRAMRALETTDSWTYSTASYRSANNSTSNRVEFVRGRLEDVVLAHVFGYFDSTTVGNPLVGVGVDSTTANSAQLFHGLANEANHDGQPQARYADTPLQGYHYLQWLERGNGSGTQTWYGDLGALMQSGICAEVWA